MDVHSRSPRNGGVGSFVIPLNVMGILGGILNVLDSCDLPGAWREVECGVGRGIRLNVVMLLRWMTLLSGGTEKAEQWRPGDDTVGTWLRQIHSFVSLEKFIIFHNISHALEH